MAVAATGRRRVTGEADARGEAMSGTSVPVPEGASIWCVAGAGVSLPAMCDLAASLIAAHRGLRAVLTPGRGVELPETLPPGVEARPRPAETRPGAIRFLDEIRPVMALFSGAEIHAAGAGLCRERNCPVVLVAARGSDRSGISQLWSDLRGRNRLRLVDRILAASPTEAEYFARSGVDPFHIETGGPLERVLPPLPCDEAERSALDGIIKTRPVWLAAGGVPEEAEQLDAAMRRAVRLSHRLLLVVVPERAADGPALAARFRDAGWRTGLRSDGDDPVDEVQVFVADVEGELGLWYRLCPVTYLGGGLTPAGTTVDPFDPARLGSAVIQGPGPTPYAAEARRLSRVRALRTIQSADELSEALLELLSPERAALLARRAWEETSRGADLHNRIGELLDETLAGLVAGGGP